MRAKLICAQLIAALILLVGVAGAQAIPANTQFDVTGFIQAATLDPTCAAGYVLCGGTITVNNQLITVPRNTVLQMPAAALTWQQVFANAPAPYTGTQTGLAMTDKPAPFVTYEAHVVGNRNGDSYIAGLIFLAQHSLQSGQGFINYINYTTGEMLIGSTIGNTTTGMRIKANDPAGKFGRAWSPDTRFTIDENNPTVRSATGYPMCVPRVAPPAPPVNGAPIVETDGLCPSVNRPLDITSPSGFAMILTMQPPAVVDANPVSNLPDPRLMAPFEVGDYVTYSGILQQDAGATTTYVAAYQVIGNVGLFTAPGADPAYVATDVMLLGVGGTTLAGAQEAAIRTRFEGFTTDISRNIVLSGVDVDACTGANPAALRNWGEIGIDQGPPAGAVAGRWRFRPPCKGLTLADVTDKVCLGPAAGIFLPPTREMRATIETVKGSGIPAAPYTTKNGLTANQYQAPIFEFLFPENVAIGSPVVPNNFEDMPFLTDGSGPLDPALAVSATNPLVGQLLPWPIGFVAPAAPPVCTVVAKTAPTADAGPAQLVAVKAAVTLSGAASADTNNPALALTFAWTQTAGTPVTLTGANTVSPTFAAPAVAGTLTFQLIVTNAATLASAPATVTITVSGLPVANAGLAQSVGSAALVTLNGAASTDAGFPPLTFAWTQTAGPAVVLKNPNTVNPTFTAPTVAKGALPVSLTFRLVVTNKAKAISAPSTVTITVGPPAPPVAKPGANQTVASATPVVTLNGTASTNATTFAWTQTGGPLVGLTGANTAIATFKAPTVNLLPSVVLTFKLTVTNTAGTSSATVTVTVVPPVDTVAISLVEYAVAQQRLTVDATSSTQATAKPAALTMQAFDANGKTLGKAQAMPFNATLNLYEVIVVGAARPTTVTVTSTYGGTASSAITRLKP